MKHLMSSLHITISHAAQRHLNGILERDAVLGRSQADSERATLLQRLRDERGRLAAAERSLDLPALHASALEYQRIAKQLMLCELADA